MSSYGLIKATSRIMRTDTIIDLNRVNTWLYGKGLPAICCYGPSVRALENSVALGIEEIETGILPELVRSEEFYRSLLPEITEKERGKFSLINKK